MNLRVFEGFCYVDCKSVVPCTNPSWISQLYACFATLRLKSYLENTDFKKMIARIPHFMDRLSLWLCKYVTSMMFYSLLQVINGMHNKIIH